MDSKISVRREPTRIDDIKQFDPLATPSPKKSGFATHDRVNRSIEVSVEPIFKTGRRIPFMDASRRNTMPNEDKKQENKVGRFSIRHASRADENSAMAAQVSPGRESPKPRRFSVDVTLTPSREEDSNLLILSPVKSCERRSSFNDDILDILF